MNLVDYDLTKNGGQGVSGGKEEEEEKRGGGGDEQMRPTSPSSSILTVRHQMHARQSR